MDLEKRVWSGWQSARVGRWSLQELKERLIQGRQILSCRLEYASQDGWEKLWVVSLRCYENVLAQLLRLLEEAPRHGALPRFPEVCRVMLREVGWTLDWLAEQKGG